MYKRQTTNIVMTANPREFLHVFNLRCARDAQWEIQDVCYAMLATAKLIAPVIFETLPVAQKDEYVKARLEAIDKAVESVRSIFESAKKGDLIEVPLDEVGLHHDVRSYIRKV